MKQTLTNPVEMHSSGTVVAASLVVTLAAAALVLALQWPAMVVAAGAGVILASTARRQGGIRHPRDADQRSTQVCAPDSGACVDV